SRPPPGGGPLYRSAERCYSSERRHHLVGRQGTRRAHGTGRSVRSSSISERFPGPVERAVRSIDCSTVRTYGPPNGTPGLSGPRPGRNSHMPAPSAPRHVRTRTSRAAVAALLGALLAVLLPVVATTPAQAADNGS